MREIKYKAFIKETKDIVNVEAISINKKYIWTSYYLDKENDRLQSFKFDEIELMQFTGLKDKNSVEIYDGYIVLMSGTVYIVTYDNDTCSFVLRAKINYDLNMYQQLILSSGKIKNIEIIGNIHENPELLEASNED